MTSGIDSLLILLILLNLILLGASRLHNAVRMVAAQGFVLGALPLLVPLNFARCHACYHG